MKYAGATNAVVFAVLNDLPQLRGRIFDQVPSAPVYPYISFGSSQALPDDAACISLTRDQLQIDIWSKSSTRAEVHELTNLVTEHLDNYFGVYLDAHSVRIFVRSSRLIPDPDAQIYHAVVSVEGLVEEHG